MNVLSKLTNRLRWLLRDRRSLSARWPGFQASPFSYATEDCRFAPNVALLSTASIFHSSLGAWTYVAGGRVVDACIGSFCSIGPDVRIGGFGRHPTRWVSTHPAFYSLPEDGRTSFCTSQLFDEHASVSIGHDVWIGAGAMVLDGITVGDGAIIGAGAVVLHDVDPYTVVAGVPARPVRQRFDDIVIARLQTSRWWDRDASILQSLAPLFRSENPLPLLAALETLPPQQPSNLHTI